MRNRYSTLLNIAVVAGPGIWKIISRYGPALIDLRNRNPAAFDKVVGSVRGLAVSAKPGGSGMGGQIEVVRKQINFLVASADDDTELQRVAGWRRRLDKIEAAAPLLDAMGARSRRAHAKALRQQLDTLAAEVLDAFIGEQAEDAGVDMTATESPTTDPRRSSDGQGA